LHRWESRQTWCENIEIDGNRIYFCKAELHDG
jgi:hypothetical protein